MGQSNTRFAMAVHVLALLQLSAGRAVGSERIALSVNTNASLIRRLLSQLAKAGLTSSVMGSGGGALLKRPGDRITLCDVFDAVADDPSMFVEHADPNGQCPIGCHIHAVLRRHTDAAERALRRRLAEDTVADVARELQRCSPPPKGIR